MFLYFGLSAIIYDDIRVFCSGAIKNALYRTAIFSVKLVLFS